MQPKTSNTPMTSSERAFLYNFMAEMNKGMSEVHYTFEYNVELKDLEIIQKTGPTCHTRHCLTKAELYTWYHEELIKYRAGTSSFSKTFEEYAEYYKMDLKTYLWLINQKIKDAVDNNPEYFI